MSKQTENIRGLYSGDAYVGQSDLRGDSSVAIEVLSLSASQVMFGNTFPAADYGNNPTVNLQTGRVLYRTNDAAIGANSYAIGVSHVYNSQCSRYASRVFRGIGNGWKLNLQQAIVREKEPIGNGSYRQVTRYIDVDGNTHEFKLFDSTGMRYYAEDDATNVLTETSTEYVLQDGLGNKFVFAKHTIDGVIVGLLSKSISCQNTSMVKYFEYDAHLRVVKVYDGRKKVGNNVKSYVELKYDDVTGLLSSVTAYDKFNQKLSVTRYEYVYDSLVKVYAVALNKAHQEVMTKAVTEFAYTNGKLTSVVDCETKSAMEFVYRADMRIYRVNYGVMCFGGAVSGAKYCGVTVVESGGVSAQVQSAQFKCKKYQEFTYHFLDGSTHVYETDISTERGVAFAHFMNRRGEIVNKMEKVGNYLYTLQREQKLLFVIMAGGTGLGEYINGREVERTSKIVAAKLFYNPYKCYDQYKQYKVCFNLRHKENYPQLLITCKINFSKSTDSLFTSSTTVTSKIDGTATNCWQEVSVLFNLSEGCNGFDMEIKLTTIDGKTTIAMDFDGVGLCPESFSYLSLIQNASLSASSVGNGVPFALCKQITFANVYGEDVTDTVKSNFMTDDDLLKTFALIKRKNGDKFDVILNGNTKRICGVSSIDGSFPLEGNVNISSCLPANVNQSLESNITVEQRFYVTRNDTLVKTIYKENNSNTLSYTEVKTDKFGNTLYSRDEYGVRTEYGYDRYGNLVSKQLFSADGVIGDAEYYFYDDNGERIDRQQSGIVGSSVQYNSFGLAEEMTTCDLADDDTNIPSGTKIRNTYDIFNDKIIRVTEYDGISVVRNNDIEYQDGRVCRVSDGTTSNGIVSDYINDEVGYTVLDGGEQCVERKRIVHSATTGTQTHITTYNVPGQVSNRQKSIADLDKYDRLTNQTSINGQTLSYEYTYSGACATAQNVSRVSNGMTDEYKYEKKFTLDAHSNVVGWTENIGTKQNSIRQLTPSLVQYTSYPNGSREDIFSELTYDTKAIGSPRLSNVTYKRSTTGYYASSNNFLLGNTDYDYDSFGRIYRKALIGLMMKTFRYETKNGHTLLVGSDITDLADIGKEVFYSDSCQYKGSRLVGLTENISDSLSTTNDGLTVNYAYNYDSCGRLTYDYNSENGYRYFVYSNGRLSRVTDSGGSQTCSYNGNGQLVGIGNNTYSYDRYGNRTGKNGQTLYEYNYGNKLVRAAGVDYTYNNDGVRCEKTFSDGKRIRYFLDGNKILRESRPTGDIIYLYDADGLTGFVYQGTFYAYIKNAQGSIVALMEANLNIHKLVARYVYDAWGNCTVYNLTRHNNLDETFVGNVNPFRWKGLYYDAESGLYYANGSFYDPKTALYVDAADISTVVDRALGGFCLDRTTLLCDNTLEIEGLPHGVFTVTELMPDPSFDPNEGKSWLRKAQDWIALIALRVSAWYRNIPRWLKIAVGITCLVAAIAITAATQSWGAVALLIKEFAKGLLVGLAFTAVTGLLAHETNMEEALLDALADGVLWGGISAFVSALANAFEMAARAGNACANGECFREGTLVETDSGLKPIEDIEVGDKVLAYDQQTGKQAYKKITRLFRNKTDKWYHVHINEQDIVCTAGHPFYVADLETFVPAKDLKVGQSVLLADETCAVIEEIRVQKLRTPETTYNFEVEDFHTYYVSDDKVLVHNRCVSAIKNDETILRDIDGDGKYGSYEIRYNTGEVYVGKGPQSRMWQSASLHEDDTISRHVMSVKWRPAKNNRAAFLQEAQWMDAAGWGGKKNRGMLLNLINSPGHRY